MRVTIRRANHLFLVSGAEELDRLEVDAALALLAVLGAALAEAAADAAEAHAQHHHRHTWIERLHCLLYCATLGFISGSKEYEIGKMVDL